MKRNILLLGLFCTALLSWADNEQTMTYDWAYDAGGSVIGVKVTSGGSASGAVVIPETMWDRPVVEIAETAFYGNASLTSVKLPATVTKIGRSAFESCTSLTSVDFGQALQTIGERAFYNDQRLAAIVLPNTVTEIGAYAFWYCAGMETATLGNSVASIGDYAFQYCTGLKSITLPNTLTSVGDHFLCSCNRLTALVIPENLTTIGTYFLHGCENMRAVYLMGDKERTLGEYPFVSQDQQHMGQVTNCTFYVDNESVYENYYRNGTNWKYADAANTDYIGDDGHYQNGGNCYKWTPRPDDIRPYEAEWITACYPTDINARAVFGDNALVAEMTAAQYKGVDAAGDYLYHMDFTLVDSKMMKAHTPYLLKVDPKNIGSAYIVEHTEEEATKTDEDLSTTVDISNQSQDPSATLTSLRMLGTYTPNGRNLQPGEFLFSNNGGNLKFYKQLQNGRQRHMGAYRCYWQIIKDHAAVTNGKLGAFDSGTTGIRTEVSVHHPDKTEVFNLKGQLIRRGADNAAGLPPGIYIANGRKMIIK